MVRRGEPGRNYHGSLLVPAEFGALRRVFVAENSIAMPFCCPYNESQRVGRVIAGSFIAR
jgi:hypothetical protein